MSTQLRSARIQKGVVYLMLYLVTFSIFLSVFFLTPHEGYNFQTLRFVIIVFSSILLTKYFLYMLLSPWHEVVVAYRDWKYRKHHKKYEPLVSVIVPAWNESMGIIRTMESVFDSTYRRVELIVINDGSTDDSDALIRSFVKRYESADPGYARDITLVYDYKINEGKGAALNRGLALSTGDLIVTVDGDCVLLPDTITNFVHYFREPDVMAAVGNVKIGNTDRLIGVIQQLEFLFSFYFKKADSFMGTIYIIGGAAGAFRREVFASLGGYKTTNITEDIDLSIRIQDAGMKIVYAADAVVYTEGASDMKSLLKQRLRWKRGRFQTFLENKQLFFSTQRRHNKLLTWLILPLAWVGEAQLSLEIGFLAFLYVYSFLISDFSSFISGIIVVLSMFLILLFWNGKQGPERSFYFLAPIGWLLFYLSTFVEVSALFKSIWSMIRGEKLTWQRWKREGVGR